MIIKFSNGAQRELAMAPDGTACYEGSAAWLMPETIIVVDGARFKVIRTAPSDYVTGVTKVWLLAL